MNTILRATAVISVCLSLLPQATNAADQSDGRTPVQALLETFHEKYGFPGATVAYVTAQGDVHSFAVGLSDVEAGIPMTPESRMLAASIGKTIWGALVLSLEAEGLIDRSDMVSDFLGEAPWFARVPNAHDITVGHLVNHTSGIPDHVHMEGVAAKVMEPSQSDSFDPVDLVSFVFDKPALFEAGTAWSYTDTGYILLGLVLEAATNTDVFELATERLLAPLGLTTTTPSNTTTLNGIAVGYTVEDNPFGLTPRTMNERGRLVWNPAVEWTGGGFVSTSANLALWGHALFTGTAADTGYLDDLLDGVPIQPDVPNILYGSGVAIYTDTPNGPVYGHGGWVPGYVSSLRYYADHALSIAFQINTDVGVVDDSTDLVPALEAALAEVLIGTELQ